MELVQNFQIAGIEGFLESTFKSIHLIKYNELMNPINYIFFKSLFLMNIDRSSIMMAFEMQSTLIFTFL